MDGPPPPEEDFSSLSIPDRLSHKNWKARVSAYEALIKIFQTTASDTDPAFRPYVNNSDLLKKIVTDSNAVAQEKGVECLVALVKYAGETVTKTREAVIPALVDKCLGSSRAGTKTQAMELALQYVEVENSGAGVVTDILPGLAAKQPKTVAGCVSVLKEIVRVFGTQTTPPPPVLKALPKIFAHSDKTVRAEGTLLTQVLYQCIGPAIEPWLADLKPVQVKELKESFETLDKEGKGKGSLKPERMTRAQAREAEVAVEAGEDVPEQQVQDEEASFDPRAFAEPVDIVSKIPSSLQTALNSSKWKERKEVLDELSTLLSATPRIKEASELGEVAKSLATRIANDANINCVMVAANCLENLAKGLMSSFARYREAVVPLMLERLKERKANVTDAIGVALDAVFACTTLADILPDLDPALKSKNPQVKEGTLKFLGRSLASATSPVPPPQIKGLADTLATLVEDGFEGARLEAANCMGTLMKMVGERPLNAVMDGLADVRKAKIKEAYEKATVKCKSSAAAPQRAPPPSAPPVKKSVVKSVPIEEPETSSSSAKKPVLKPPPKPPAPKKPAPPVASSSVAKKPAATSSSSKPSASASAGTLDSFKYKHTPEDAEALAADLIPAPILTDLGDANWKTRLAALDEMISWLGGVIEGVDAEVVTRALMKRAASEKNFQVSSKVYAVFTQLAQSCPSFGRSCPALCISHLTDKLGDMKLKKPAGDTLIAFAERTSLQFVLNQAYGPLTAQKAPKVLADAVTWVNQALTEFGISGLSLRGVIEFLKTCLQNSNAAVRTSATKALVTVKLYAGSNIKDFLEDLNPQLLNTIIAEFDKVEGNPAPEPSRTSSEVASTMTDSSSKKGGGDPLDELFPRVEIDNLLKGTTILVDSKSDAWKTKKEALEGLQSILDHGSNKRLKPTMGDIGQVLKARITDTNKAVQSLALDIVSKIAVGMGKPFERYSRLFVLPVATVLADQKAPIRAAALQTLTTIATACQGIDSMITGISSGLETANPLQKGTLLHWIVDWFKEHQPSASPEFKPWAPLVVSSLDDRNSEIRKGAQSLLPSLILCLGYDFVFQQTNSLKPASRASAVPLIEVARPAVTPSVVEPKEPKIQAKSTPISTSAAQSSAEEDAQPIDDGLTAKAVPKLMGVRRKLPAGKTRPESVVGAPSTNGTAKRAGGVAQSVSTPGWPFSGNNPDSKKSRTGKDAQKWINDGGATRKDLSDLLQSQMEPFASAELLTRLFSHDHNAINDHIQGLTMMCDFYAGANTGDDKMDSICLANFDFPMKYASMKAHEPQPNLISKCLEVVEAVLAFLCESGYQLTDAEALCFVPTMIFKLGDPREPVRARVQQIVRTLPKVYAYSRVFQLLLDHGLKSRVAKTRQGTLDELAFLLKKSGIGACDPGKALPSIASMISDRDSTVRKSALGVLSEAYTLVGEKVWAYVGPLPPKDKTQLEERLRRVTGPATSEPDTQVAAPAPAAGVARLTSGIVRPSSPAAGSSRISALAKPASPSLPPVSRLARPASPARTLRLASPTIKSFPRPESPARSAGVPVQQVVPPSPTGSARPKSLLPSRLSRPRSNLPAPSSINARTEVYTDDRVASSMRKPSSEVRPHHEDVNTPEVADDVTVTISSILSSDPTRSVDALKKVQKILAVGPEAGPSSPMYRELAEHTEGLIETIILQMAHVFERPEDLIPEDNFRLAKHLIQSLNNFCDHAFLAESLTVEILTLLLEELTLRLLETDDSPVKKVKDLSRFINMIILRLFATGRRMSIFRALFALLLQIVKPFPNNGTLADSKESKVAELVLKCVWKLARNIPQDLKEQHLDPVELFPAIEQFLQTVPPNEWRARSTNKVPCGDMPLRTIKVIIQHVVAHYGDDVYELLSASFDDPSATIVYPYVYRILNSRAPADIPVRASVPVEHTTRASSPTSSRPISPQTASSVASHRQSPTRTSPSSSSNNGTGGFSPSVQEPDPDALLLTIIGHISSETTGALHKEGITELHHFLKAHPHKKARVEKMLESTGAAFRKYINRALASRAAEDEERDVAVAATLSKLESNNHEITPASPAATERSPRQATSTDGSEKQDKLSRLHDIFQYRSSTVSNGSSSSYGRATARTSLS